MPQETVLTFDYSVMEMVLMGRYPHLGAFELEGPSDRAAARRRSSDRHRRARRSAVQHTQRRREATRRHRIGARTTGHAKRPEPRAISPRSPDERGTGRWWASAPDGVLLLDEPTASLDLRYQLEVAALLKRLRAERGLTIVLSTHDLRLAKAVCTHVVLLSRGRVLADGPVANVLTPALIGQLFDVDPAVAAPLLA